MGIEPGIGRLLHYYPAGHPGGALPHAALIVGIIDDRTINLAIFDAEGHHYHGTDVPLIQEDTDVRPADRGWAEWMPFQKGQAAKTEAVTDQLQQDVAAKFAAIEARIPPLAPAPVPQTPAPAAVAPQPAPAPQPSPAPAAAALAPAAPAPAPAAAAPAQPVPPPPAAG